MKLMIEIAFFLSLVVPFGVIGLIAWIFLRGIGGMVCSFLGGVFRGMKTE